MSVTMAGRAELVKSGRTQWALALACLAIWLAKVWLILRININWDEFYFLNLIHAETRGELTQGLQTAYTHLFAWLTRVDGDEIRQILVARALMVLLLGISVLLIQRLATRWLSPTAAWAAAVAFLVTTPVLRHGGSFRADSLLLPLEIGALVVLTHRRLDDRKRGAGAGLLLGLATAISIKTALLAPVVAVLGIDDLRNFRRGLHRLAWLAGAAVVTAAALLGAHLLSISGAAAESAGAVAQGAWQKTIGHSRWFPQLLTLRVQLHEDRIFWLLALAGFAWSLWRRQWALAGCALALLPILFYRNSFPYFYVLMWGPACLTIGAASQGLQELSTRDTRPGLARLAAVALPMLLLIQGLVRLPFLSTPRQGAQRQLVAAVHQIFPTPVPYIDHSGMIASFPKANFFMSSWGVENYRSSGQPFMPVAIARYHPPLLIENRDELIPGSYTFSLLLKEDQEIIQSLYQPYWGPIRVAGGAATFIEPGSTTMRVPFGGRYRLESPRAVRIDSREVAPGAIIGIGAEQPGVRIDAGDGASRESPETVRLLWADALPPPDDPPTSLNYYDGL